MVASLEALIASEGADTIAAFIAEPVLGAGGVVPPPKTYFEKIQPVLAQHDILFLDDEVICGFGRTGNMFGAETYDLQPDAISLAKALSSAYLPISAVMISEDIFQAAVEESAKIGTFGHGFTYSGHPVPAAVAIRTLELYEERNIVGHVQKVASHFQARLRSFGEHPLVGNARGVGLIGALELVADKTTKRAFAPAQGVGAHTASGCEKRGLDRTRPGRCRRLLPAPDHYRSRD